MTLCFSVRNSGATCVVKWYCNVTTFWLTVQYLPIGICFSVGAFVGRVCVEVSRKLGASAMRGGEPILVVGLTYIGRDDDLYRMAKKAI